MEYFSTQLNIILFVIGCIAYSVFMFATILEFRKMKKENSENSDNLRFRAVMNNYNKSSEKMKEKVL